MKKINILLAVSAALALGVFAAAFFIFRNIKHLLVVHFDVFRGIDFLGTSAQVINIGWIILALNMVNIILSRYLYYRDKFLAYILSLGNLAITLFASAAVIVIALSN